MTYLEELREAKAEAKAETRAEDIRIILDFLKDYGVPTAKAIEQIALKYNLSEEEIKEIINSVPQPSI